MRLVVSDVGAAHLDEVRRFSAPWEAQASLVLRAGNPAALAEYDQRARIVGGTAEQMEEAAYRAWLADTLSGKTSLLMADTNEQAAALASRARVDLVRLGHVEASGTPLADGNRAGVGDRVATRRNDWELADTGRAVANRDQWIVDDVGSDGSLRVHPDGDHQRRGDQVLPAEYVAEHVELAYASTGHGAQGRTVDTGHAVLSESSSKEGVYVEMTRGREGNWAYVACDVHPGQDQDRIIGDPVGTLAQVMTTGEPALAATQVLRDEHDRVESRHTLYPQWNDAVDQHTHTRWTAAVDETAAPDVAAQIRNGAAWPTLARHLQAIDSAGGDAAAVLATAVHQRDLDGVYDAAAVIDSRLQLATVGAGPAPIRERPSFVEATPATVVGVEADSVLTYARQVAAHMDARVEALADRALQDPPPWAAPLGAVPEDPVDRLEWADRAGTVAAYRELAGIDGDDPLGDRPGPLHPESRVRWDTANQALHGPAPAGNEVSDEDLQAVVDGAARRAVDAPPIVVGELRQAQEQARQAETAAGLVQLAGPQPAGDDVDISPSVADRAVQARAEAARLEQAHQDRQDWMGDNGPDLAASAVAAAELARREQDRAARPFADLTAQDLANGIADLEDDLSRLERRIETRIATVDAREEQASTWEHEAYSIEWETPAWTRHTQDRQAETAAAARLGELTDSLERSALRGGPRGRDRAQMETEAGRLRQAHPGLDDSTDRTALWDQRGEVAWATDETAAQELRARAATVRSEAATARDNLPRLTDARSSLQDRLQQMRDETRLRPGEAVPADSRWERSRPKVSLNPTDGPTPASDPEPSIGIRAEQTRPPQR